MRPLGLKFCCIGFVLVALCLCIPANVHADPSLETVTLATTPTILPSFGVGETSLFSGIGSPQANPTSQAAAENLVSSFEYHNRAIYGWGMPDPNPSPGVYNWTALDAAVSAMSKGGTPVLTLCCSPGWMTILGHTTGGQPDYTEAPASNHFEDFAHLAAVIAQRYPQVTHFQVWNELKGFYWNMDQYNGYVGFYNDVYDALKAVNPNIQVGGPYLPVMGGDLPGTSGTDAQPIPEWQMMNFDSFNLWAHGYQFLSLDYSVLDYNAPVAISPTQSFLDNTITETVRFGNIVNQLRADPNFKTVPIWFSEDYCDVNLGRIAYMTDNYQAACLASILYQEVTHGVAVSLRWSPEGNNEGPLTGGNIDQESLYSDMSVSGAPLPYPSYGVYSLFNALFGQGAKIYAATINDPMVLALGVGSEILLINQANVSKTIYINGRSIALAPYQVGAWGIQ